MSDSGLDAIEAFEFVWSSELRMKTCYFLKMKFLVSSDFFTTETQCYDRPFILPKRAMSTL